MNLFIRSLAVATVAVGIFLGAASAVEEEYEGASFCRDYPAWPNGSYLGQMHPYHSAFYTRFAERRGLDACQTWAADQRDSAARGLRELGYAVLTPAEVRMFPFTISGHGTGVPDPFALSDGRYRITTRLDGNHSRHGREGGAIFDAILHSHQGNTALLQQTAAISGHWERLLIVGGDRSPEASPHAGRDPFFSSPIILEVRLAEGSWSVTFERID